MYGILLGLIMGGVGWVVIWSVYEPDRTSRYWWPFEMKEAPETAAPEQAASATPWRRQVHSRPARAGAAAPGGPARTTSTAQRARTEKHPPKKPWQRRSGS
jgi:hypothetical protein